MTLPLQQHLEDMRIRGLSPVTIYDRERTLIRLKAFLDVESLSAVTVQDLERWQTSIMRLTPEGRASSISDVQNFYRWAYKKGIIASDPSTVLIRPKVPKRVPRPIAERDLEMAIRCARNPVRMWLILAAYCGLRCAELSRMERCDLLETRDPAVLIVRGKGNKERIVPVPRPVLDELRLCGLPSAGYLFRRPSDGGPYRPHRVSHLANQHLHGLGIPDTLHSLRHRYGSSIYRLSLDFRMTQEVMGHANPATTAGYVAFSPSHAAGVVEQLALTLHSRHEVVA